MWPPSTKHIVSFVPKGKRVQGELWHYPNSHIQIPLTGTSILYLFLINLLNTSHGLGQLLLLSSEDDFCPVNTGWRDVDTSPCLLHDLTHKPIVRPSDEGVEGLLHVKPLYSTLVLHRAERADENTVEQQSSTKSQSSLTYTWRL